MRTRSQAIAENIVSRKRKTGDDSAAHDDGARSKRRKVQTRRKSFDQDMAHHSSALTETADQLYSGSLACRDGDDVLVKEKLSEKQGRKDSLHTQIEHDSVVPTQGVALESCSLVSERSSDTQRNAVQGLQEQNVITCDDSIQHHDEEEIAISLRELAGALSQSEKDRENEAFPTPAQNGPGKLLQFSLRKRKGTVLRSDRPSKNNSHSGLKENSNRRNQTHSCPSTDQKKQRKKRKLANSLTMPQNSKSPSQRRMNAAKMRWKHLAQSILYGKTSPANISASDKLQLPRCGNTINVKEQTHCVENRPSYERQSLRKRRKTFAGQSRQRPMGRRQHQMLGKQQGRLLRWMKTWLTQAKFSQIAKDENSDVVGESFIMTEDLRNAFVQTMVKSCQDYPNMRTLFLESVKILTINGLMHAAASTVLQEESCEQAKTLMDAWATFQGEDAATKKVPLTLLNAVNQLHEMRGDLSTKLNTSKSSYEYKQLDEKTWKFKLPNLPIEDQNLGQDDISPYEGAIREGTVALDQCPYQGGSFPT